MSKGNTFNKPDEETLTNTMIPDTNHVLMSDMLHGQVPALEDAEYAELEPSPLVAVLEDEQRPLVGTVISIGAVKKNIELEINVILDEGLDLLRFLLNGKTLRYEGLTVEGGDSKDAFYANELTISEARMLSIDTKRSMCVMLLNLTPTE